MKVIITEKIHESGPELLESKGIQVSRRFGITYQELSNEIQDADAIIVRNMIPIDKNLMEKGKKLKAIAMNGIGLNHIDTAYAKEKGIAVINCPEGSIDSVAELTIGIMLSVARKIPSSHQHVKQGGWEKNKYIGTQLKGKTLGVVAIGKIGSRVAKICQAMGMNVIAFDPYCPENIAREMNVKLVSLDELITQSDVITIHAPLTPETKDMLSDEQVAKMKDGVIILNMGRGGILSEQAAYNGLKSGKIGGIGLDVTVAEPPGKDFPLLEFDNVVITPHIGASTKEAQEYISKAVAGKVADILLGK
jgi:D-3-phosphoglycerate dehydrogenase